MVNCRSRREICFILLFSIDMLTNKVCSQNETGVKEELTYHEQEARLRAVILLNYSHVIRPSKIVNISLSLHILRLNELDIHLQRMEASGWLDVRWNDPRLTWDPQLFGGIHEIYDSELVLWRPEIVVDNSVRQIAVLGDKKMFLRADYRGNMLWEPPNIFHTHCDVAVTYFPFDTQTCHVEIGTWGLTDKEVNLVPFQSEIDLADFKENAEWIALTSWTTRSVLLDGDDKHEEVYFYLRLQRRPVHHVLTILFPVVVTSLMASVVFLVPTSSGSKIQFSLTILLTYTVMLSIVSAYLPSSSNTVSVLSVFLTIILVSSVQVTFLVVLIVNLYHRHHETPVPGWVRCVIGSCMLRLISCRRPRCCGNKPTPPQKDKSTSNSADTAPEAEAIKMDKNQHESLETSPLDDVVVTPSNDTSTSIDNSVHVFSLGPTQENASEESRAAVQTLTWKECSEIMNKFCLTFMTPFVILVTLIGAAVLFLGSSSDISHE